MNIGEYKVTTERSENSLYRWVEAVNTQKEKTVIIQILQPGISPVRYGTPKVINCL